MNGVDHSCSGGGEGRKTLTAFGVWLMSDRMQGSGFADSDLQQARPGEVAFQMPNLETVRLAKLLKDGAPFESFSIPDKTG